MALQRAMPVARRVSGFVMKGVVTVVVIAAKGECIRSNFRGAPMFTRQNLRQQKRISAQIVQQGQDDNKCKSLHDLNSMRPVPACKRCSHVQGVLTGKLSRKGRYPVGIAVESFVQAAEFQLMLFSKHRQTLSREEADMAVAGRAIPPIDT